MCFAAGEFLTGPNDILLGEIDGCPFYIDLQLDKAWNEADFVLDVAEGDPEGFSLGAGPGKHFVTRSEVCAVPAASTISGPRQSMMKEEETHEGSSSP